MVTVRSAIITTTFIKAIVPITIPSRITNRILPTALPSTLPYPISDTRSSQATTKMDTTFVYPPATPLHIKEALVYEIMAHRKSTKEILNRSDGEFMYMANAGSRQVLSKQGHGRWLWIPPLVKEEVMEVLGRELHARVKTRLGCEEAKRQVGGLLVAEIRTEGYDKYLVEGEEVETMGLEELVDVCAHGRLMFHYGEPAKTSDMVAPAVNGVHGGLDNEEEA
ncbi:hypothetical protein GE09DRAFT_1058458 [Coniochaeta sp. 2T2.1]|nr:hypothetical protein GE09DRAFT_1058458 [Coniochaeta sp. 2T2.1]